MLCRCFRWQNKCPALGARSQFAMSMSMLDDSSTSSISPFLDSFIPGASSWITQQLAHAYKEKGKHHHQQPARDADGDGDVCDSTHVPHIKCTKLVTFIYVCFCYFFLRIHLVQNEKGTFDYLIIFTYIFCNVFFKYCKNFIAVNEMQIYRQNKNYKKKFCNTIKNICF